MRYRTYGRVTGRGQGVTATGTDVVTTTLQTRDAALTLTLKADGDYTLEVHEPAMNAPHKNGRLLTDGNAHEQLEE